MSHVTDAHLVPDAARQPTSSPDSSQTDWRWQTDPLEPPPHEAIAREAYALYAARGYQDGWDVEDWLAAEESLRFVRRDEES
jgi:hypothetical protein